MFEFWLFCRACFAVLATNICILVLIAYKLLHLFVVAILKPSLILCLSTLVVTIGFSPVNYSVNEVDGSVTLFAMLLSGTLEREVSVQFSTVDASASETGISMHE